MGKGLIRIFRAPVYCFVWGGISGSFEQTISRYKDVVIRISIYSKTKTEAGARGHRVYKSFVPGSNKGFAFKTGNCLDMMNVALVSGVVK